MPSITQGNLLGGKPYRPSSKSKAPRHKYKTPTDAKGRICARCHIYKPWSKFYLDPRHRTGYQSYCKSCHAQYSNKRRQTSKYRVQAHKRQRRRAADPAYRIKQLARLRHREHSRRAEFYGAPDAITREEWNSLDLHPTSTHCPYCLRPLKPAGSLRPARYADHIRPMSALPPGANDLANLTICCQGCSNQKASNVLTPPILSELRGCPCTDADVQAIIDDARRRADEIRASLARQNHAGGPHA